MKCEEIDYEIHGHDLQFVEVELDPSETVIAEAGAMMYMQENISFEAKLGDGANPDEGFFGKLMGAGKRYLTGDSLFLTHFTNQGSEGKKRVAFSAPYPGTIVPVDLSQHNGHIICQKSSFLCAARGTKIEIAFSKRIGAGLFGGEGFILQRLEGDGMIFIAAGGTVVKRELKGERLRIDPGCIVGFDGNIEYDIERAGNLKSMFFGGEGLFLATLQGTGSVWLQSMPFSKLADRVLANAPAVGGKSTGQGSVLGNIFPD